MNKKRLKSIKSTSEEFVESLTPVERKEFEEEYKDLLLSEMLLALMEQDEVSVRKLAKLAKVSPTVVQAMRSGIKKNFSLQSFFKVINSLGCKVVIERNGHQFSLNFNAESK